MEARASFDPTRPAVDPAADSAVDAAPQPWTGRYDGDGDEHRRWWQAVQPVDRFTRHEKAVSSPAVLLGFASDEGVRRNQGRLGAAKAPAELRKALGPLAFHLDRDVFDAGDVAVADGNLEAGQTRAGQAITALIDAGALPVVLGGGHETAFASYLGVAGSSVVRGGKRLGVLNLDAHFDLRDEPTATSGTPFLQMARAEAAAGRELRYAVVGISEPNNTKTLFTTAERLGVRFLTDEECSPERVRDFVAGFLDGIDVLYLTIDLDVLPAAVAPGVSAPASYGVPLPVIAEVCRQVAASGKLLHLDVAELNPEYDVDSRTAKVAARLVNTLLR
ncbi:formimidoylglutamase [Pseudarthrobacter sp. J75]|uniref:formimidoylglutamase n=1 Tax=unclassified Pseudarthrobacter TaxID=2647000 RepID=UPI002E7FC754|nr:MULTISPECIES: formimidoylglutamase [unclassified Pseudarthrobacter]MEE2523506.1 formimidoylglutamase [Pseudarthrobacter sp. J47]MEE2530481.1 formimidoylglutamase [Pseudarthrobacter sp. J75]